MFKLCASPKDDLAVTLCRTYLSGLLDGLRMTDGHVGVFSFCLPEVGVSTELVHAMYTRYFLKHRDERRMLQEGYTARIAIVTMLAEEYPCPGAKKED